MNPPKAAQTLTIVVPVFNRPESLRLLQSTLSSLQPCEGLQLDLQFSQDLLPGGEAHPEVTQLCAAFQWHLGTCTHTLQPRHLGLREHLLFIGDLTQQLGPLVVLEDDLLVSPVLTAFLKSALAIARQHPELPAIALFNYRVAESHYGPFQPIDDGRDFYRLQVAPSWGQLWLPEGWAAFRQWLAAGPRRTPRPEYLNLWSTQSWKRDYTHWLVETGRYALYPKRSYTTTTGARGTHETHPGLFGQPLATQSNRIDETLSIETCIPYDAWWEPDAAWLATQVPALQEYAFTVDLEGRKEQLNTPWVLTTARRAKRGALPVLQWSDVLEPAAMNLLMGIPGEGYGLYPHSALKRALRFGFWRWRRMQSLRKALLWAGLREMMQDFLRL